MLVALAFDAVDGCLGFVVGVGFRADVISGVKGHLAHLGYGILHASEFKGLELILEGCQVSRRYAFLVLGILLESFKI